MGLEKINKSQLRSHSTQVFKDMHIVSAGVDSEWSTCCLHNREKRGLSNPFCSYMLHLSTTKTYSHIKLHKTWQINRWTETCIYNHRREKIVSKFYVKGFDTLKEYLCTREWVIFPLLAHHGIFDSNSVAILYRCSHSCITESRHSAQSDKLYSKGLVMGHKMHCGLSICEAKHHHNTFCGDKRIKKISCAMKIFQKL